MGTSGGFSGKGKQDFSLLEKAFQQMETGPMIQSSIGSRPVPQLAKVNR